MSQCRWTIASRLVPFAVRIIWRSSSNLSCLPCFLQLIISSPYLLTTSSHILQLLILTRLSTLSTFDPNFVKLISPNYQKIFSLALIERLVLRRMFKLRQVLSLQFMNIFSRISKHFPISLTIFKLRQMSLTLCPPLELLFQQLLTFLFFGSKSGFFLLCFCFRTSLDQ